MVKAQASLNQLWLSLALWWLNMIDLKHKGLKPSLEVLKQQRRAKVVGQALSVTGAVIGALCVVFATHVALS